MADPFQSDEWSDDQVVDLVERARGGCAESREKLFGQLRNYLAFVADQQLDKRLQAKVGPSDIVQQSFIRAVEGIDEFRGATAAEFKGWLRQIAVNEARQVQRGYNADKRQVAMEQRVEDASDTSGAGFQIADSLWTPQTNALVEEEAAAVRAALERMPVKYRTVIEMRNWKGMQFNEIADELGLTVSAAAKLWYRGLAMLQQEFDGTSTD